METIKWQTWAMYGYRPKSICMGLGCSLGWTTDSCDAQC